MTERPQRESFPPTFFSYISELWAVKEFFFMIITFFFSLLGFNWEPVVRRWTRTCCTLIHRRQLWFNKWLWCRVVWCDVEWCVVMDSCRDDDIAVRRHPVFQWWWVTHMDELWCGIGNRILRPHTLPSLASNHRHWLTMQLKLVSQRKRAFHCWNKEFSHKEKKKKIWEKENYGIILDILWISLSKIQSSWMEGGWKNSSHSNTPGFLYKETQFIELAMND